ncbi:uncharacterized protein [Palaemon carinicauda]|uniref:uncharacterized protein n=1 Tax=Palaemon carinicauda TaxID=392227 RepID=UPI0035B6338A
MMMTPRAEKALAEWIAVNNRLFLAKFKSQQYNMSIIICYAPTNDSPDERKDDYHEELNIFQHKDIRKYAWTSPYGNYKNQIDHIAINHERRRTLRNVRSYRDADIGSDHQLLITTLKLKLKAPNRDVDRMPGFDTTKLLEDEHSKTFAIECRN